MAKTKYKKYKVLYLPKVMVETIIINHKIRIDDFELVKLDICFEFLNIIIRNSVFFNSSKDESKDLFSLVASTYLNKRFGNKYKIHKDFLVNNNLIYLDNHYEGKATNFYIQDINTYKRLLNHRLKDYNNLDVNLLYIPYCVSNRIEIAPVSTVNNNETENQKNRILEGFYKIKILISRGNRSYFTGNYVSDSEFINNAPKHIKKMGSYFRKKFALDTERALKYAENKYQNEVDDAIRKDEEKKAYNRYISRISSIRLIDKGKLNKSLRFHRNKTNKRLDTNLTNMASDLKQFIIGWDRMVYLDLKNSQPVLFNAILKDYYKKGSNDLKREIDNYRVCTLNGSWYETLMEIFNEDRKTCKEIWMCIAYSKNKSYQQYKKPFKRVYPKIYNIIENIKKKNYKEFAIELQKLESKIFIDKICKELVNVGIIPFTVHDALIVNKDEQEQTLNIMNMVFIEYLGDSPIISIE